MFSDNEFKAGRITYHRNGIAGRGFYTVEFKFKDGGRGSPLNMVATVTDLKAQTEIECYVVQLSNPGKTWRGDRFYANVVRAIETSEPWNWTAAKAKV